MVYHAKATNDETLLTTDEQELAIKKNKDYLVGGVRMNIKDIKAIQSPVTPRGATLTVKDENEMLATLTSKKGSTLKKASVDFNTSNASPLVNGMSPAAARTFKAMENELTKEELGVSDKKIIIPSFHTTSKLFAQHF